MDVVQSDLDRTVTDAPRLQVLVIQHDESWAEIEDDHLTAYVAGPGGGYWALLAGSHCGQLGVTAAAGYSAHH